MKPREHLTSEDLLNVIIKKLEQTRIYGEVTEGVLEDADYVVDDITAGFVLIDGRMYSIEIERYREQN